MGEKGHVRTNPVLAFPPGDNSKCLPVPNLGMREWGPGTQPVDEFVRG